MQFKQNVSVIGDIIHLDQVTLLFFEYSASVVMKVSERGVWKKGRAVLGAERKMDEQFRQGLGHWKDSLDSRRAQISLTLSA